MSSKNMVQVWDIFVRVFHWSLVVCFTIAYLSAEDESALHIYSGYAVLGLVTFRLLWGFVGSKYARFSDFVYPPSVVINYLKSLLTKNPQRYIGHNPVGGWMVIALLVSLTMVTVSGLKLYAIEEGKGPLASAVHVVLIDNAHADDEDEDRNDKEEASEEFWEEIHEVTTNLTLLLILLHIAGVVISSRLHKENLVKSMITGKKEDL